MKTGNEETTLDLNQVMEEGMDEFQGELNEAAREKTDDGGRTAEDGGRTAEDESITPKPTEDASPPEGQRTDDGGRTAEDPDPEADAAGTDAGDTPEEDKHFRFKSHEEAENGYRHLQSAKTRAEEEAARLRAELEKATAAEEAKKKREKADKDLLEYMTDEHEKALDAIDELNPDDPGYRKQVARIWAEKDSAVEVRKRDLYQEDVATPPADAGSTDAGSAGATAENKGWSWEDIKDRARSQGIDPDSKIFEWACAAAPGEGSMEDQIDWAVQQIKDDRKKQEQQFQERQKKAAKERSDAHQEKNLPLGRSPADRTASTPEKPPEVTLSDALESAQEERRL